jgi:hypothetical protein
MNPCRYTKKKVSILLFYPEDGAAGSSETVAPLNQTTWCYIPKDDNLHIYNVTILQSDMYI